MSDQTSRSAPESREETVDELRVRLGTSAWTLTREGEIVVLGTAEILNRAQAVAAHNAAREALNG